MPELPDGPAPMHDNGVSGRRLPALSEGTLPAQGPWTTYLLPEDTGPPATSVRGLLKRQWPIIAGATVAVFLATAFFTYTRPSVFESSSSFLLQGAGGGGDQPLDALGSVGGTAGIETETRLLVSQRVVEPAVRDLGLNARVVTDDGTRPIGEVFPDFQIGLEVTRGEYRIVPGDDGAFTVRSGDSIISRAGPGSDIQFAGLTLAPPPRPEAFTVQVASLDQVVAGARSRLDAVPEGRDTEIIRLTCSGSTAQSAHSLCQAVSENYIRLRTELQRAEAKSTAEFLRGQAESVELRLRAAEDSLGTYQRQHLAIALDAMANAAVSQQASFQSQRDQMEAERRALSQLIDRIESAGSGQYRNLASFPTFLQSGNPVIGDLLGTLVNLENERVTLLRTRTERNPDIVAIDTRIAQIENELKAIATNYEQSLSAQIQSLSTMAGRASGRAAAVPEKQVETGRLERQVSLLDELYRFLQTRLREAEVAQSVSMPSVQIVDPPTMPLRRSSPNVPLNLAVGLALGLGFGVLLALYRERSDTSVRERGAAEGVTGVPVLAMIPSMENPGPILPVSGNGTKAILPVPKSLVHEVTREAFRGLIADLQIAAHHVRNGGIRSLAITSSTRGEGKTFSACNLALAHSGSASRTLLIDADVRGKGVARFLGLGSSDPGLADVLAGSVALEHAWRSLTIDGRAELFVLPSGRIDGSRNSMLDLDRFSDLIRDAKSQFDLVIVDTPPLNVISDAAVIAASVDTVMVVVRGGKTDRQALDLTVERLKRSHGHIMGIVLNDVDLPEYYTSYSHESPQ